MIDLGFVLCKTDPNIWLKRAKTPCGFEYYEYVLIYVNNILHIAYDTHPVMKRIGQLYELKDCNVGGPKHYLGPNINKYQLPDGREVWSMSSQDYCASTCKLVNEMLSEEGHKLQGKNGRSYPASYKPELDTTEELAEKLMSRYQQLIGILIWCVELRHIDIRFEHLNSKVVFDDAVIPADEKAFVRANWDDFYTHVTEEMPLGMPEPLGLLVIMTVFVHADHAGNLLNCRSHTGIHIPLNSDLVDWFSKAHNMVESSTFGSKSVAMRVPIDKIEALKYKLSCVPAPLLGPQY
eukprot:12064677-Ditylum_brightwellii.AAC.1